MSADPAYRVVREHPVLDGILSDHRGVIADQFDGYRNHCLMVYNLVLVARPLYADQDVTVAIAAAFHDIALWTDDRIDYLDPSAARAVAYCERTGRAAAAPLVADMILYHHKVTTGGLRRFDPLVRTFRDADWSAFTFGLIPFNMFAGYRRAVGAAFPDAGFHAFLTRRTARHLRSGGIGNPLPMMKW